MIDQALHQFFDAKIVRRKTTFLLHAFEQELYAFTCNASVSLSDLPPAVLATIRDRVSARGQSLSASAGVAEHLENAYLDEVFQSAISACKGTDSETLLRALRQRCEFAGFYEIRNACAHPTRDFPVFYWYRVASVASDPLISMLRMAAIQEALISAEDDRISDPPAEWMARFVSQVPNNLPSQSLHEITGLVGRDKESGQLLERLGSIGISRLALTGYGGIGKTALAVQALQKVCLDPALVPGLQGVVYVSLKTEQLTADGIVSLANDAAAKAIEHAVAEAMQEAGVLASSDTTILAAADKKLIVCIDNAESLLKEDEAAFMEFLDALPANWKILVTSRLSVDGARTLALGPLGKSQSEFLARRYIAARNISADSELARQVGLAARGNPLCVRLILDKICLGIDVSDAIRVAGDDLVKFSFTTLLEVLPDAALRILETLYLTGSASRTELIELLELDDDSIIEAMRVLQKTSLIVTSFANGFESISLNESVNELLLNRPLLSAGRDEVRDKLRQRSQRLQQQLDKQERTGNDAWHFSFIPTDTPIALKTLLIDANDAAGKNGGRERLLAIAGRLANAEKSFAGNGYYWKGRGRVLEALGDPSAEAAYRRAVALISPSDPATVMLATCLAKQGQALEATKLFAPLIERRVHFDDHVNPRARRALAYGYARALRDLDRFADVLTFCGTIGRQVELLGAIAPFWVSALRQDPTLDQRGAVYLEAMDLAQECADKGVHSPVLVEEVCKLLSGLKWDVEHDRVTPSEFLELQKRLRILQPPLSSARSPNFDAGKFEEVCRTILGEGKKALTHDEVELVGRGYIPVVVDRIPAVQGYDFPSFLFCRAEDGEVFFCHRKALSDAEAPLWQELHVGDRLLLLPADKPAGADKNRVAVAVVILSDG